MKICKYCKKPISDEQVWNPDVEGNGYHHACLCEMEFISRDRQIYNKGRSDVLDKIREEIEEEKGCAYADFERYKVEYLGVDVEYAEDELPQDDFRYGMERCIEIINKYRAESEKKDADSD